jgi:Helicase conserved C-terminal domain
MGMGGEAGTMTRITLDCSRAEDYATFLKVKALPKYRFVGREAVFPSEYADRLGIEPPRRDDNSGYSPIRGLFDYQRDIASLAIRKRKFAVFAEPGLGKTLILLEFARNARQQLGNGRSVLIVSPPMVIPQTIAEASRFYGDSLPVRRVRAAELPAWAEAGRGIGITNYEALTPDVPQGRIGALIPDESSVMKSAYGKWGQELIRLGKGLEWKLALTGTPAPNDRIEYANHAVFLDAFPTVNSFLAKFFVNRGQTDNRWELKPHALRPFYRALSHWCIFLTNPATYGWKDNAGTIPPIRVHVHDVDLTDAQNDAIRALNGSLFSNHVGGIGDRSKLARIAKNGDSRKPAFIRSLVESWPDESTLIWCRFNDEQERLASEIPGAASISGDTPEAERERIVAGFQSGEIRTLVTKAKILGLGLNLQVCTRQIFSSCHDSYEEYFQAVKRSNRVGSTRPLNVHLPVTEAERPMMENVLRKAHRVEMDTREQEELFKHAVA